MSLLLDALKKAADDKQKSLQAEPDDPAILSSSSSGPDSSNTENTEVAGQETEELTLEGTEEDINEVLPADDIAASLELDIAELGHELKSQDVSSDEANTENTQIESLSLEDTSSASTGEFTVSDDALSMLINKTNRDVKQGKKTVIASALVAGLVILVLGGVYFYMDMQAEISALERKHKIAMQSIRAKTNKEKAPEKSEIIRNLVSESGLDEKVQYAKQHICED